VYALTTPTRSAIIPALVLSSIAVINAWNRVAVAARTEPGHYQPPRTPPPDAAQATARQASNNASSVARPPAAAPAGSASSVGIRSGSPVSARNATPDTAPASSSAYDA
jgi:hypothetical protein